MSIDYDTIKKHKSKGGVNMNIHCFEKKISRDSLNQILINCSAYIPFFLFSLCFMTGTIGVPIIGEGIVVIILIFITKLQYILVILCIILILLPIVYKARKKRSFKLSNTLLLITLGGCTLLLPFVLFYLYFGLTSVSTSLGLGTEGLMGIMSIILLISGWGFRSHNRKCNFIGSFSLLILDSFIVILFNHSVLIMLTLLTVLTLYFVEIFILRELASKKITS